MINFFRFPYIMILRTFIFDLILLELIFFEILKPISIISTIETNLFFAFQTTYM